MNEFFAYRDADICFTAPVGTSSASVQERGESRSPVEASGTITCLTALIVVEKVQCQRYGNSLNGRALTFLKELRIFSQMKSSEHSSQQQTELLARGRHPFSGALARQSLGRLLRSDSEDQPRLVQHRGTVHSIYRSKKVG